MSASMALVDTLLETSHDPMWIIDAKGEIVRSNRAFARLPSLGSFDDIYSRALAGRVVVADRWTENKHYAVTANPVHEGDAVAGAVLIVRDITQSRGEHREQLHELALTRLFEGDEPLGAILTRVLEFLCETDEWDAGVLWLIENDVLNPVALWAKPELDVSAFREQCESIHFVRGRGLAGRVWAADDVIWVADLNDETGLLRAMGAMQAGLHGAAGMTMHDAERIIGVLELFTCAVVPISEPRQRLLRQAGRSLGRLIARRRSEDERRELLGLVERKGFEWTLTFDAIELPIFITRLDGRVSRMNRAARDLTGRDDFSEVLGMPIRKIDRGEPWRTLADLVDAVRDSHTPCTAQITNGNGRTWDASASWYHSPGDNEERAILIARDTTMLAQLQESVRRGEQLAALGELVAGVAHQVRNPIFGMRLTVDALEAMLPPNDPEVKEMYDILRQWLERMNTLMEHLLEYGKSWTLDLAEGNAGEVLYHAVEGVKPIAERAGVRIEVDVQPAQIILMDPHRLGQAFENIITNAVQHSPPGGRVDVYLRTEGLTIECVVRDHGPGFPATDLPRIFEPFFTRRRGGTGLGLSIVQRVVDEHGGTINAGNAADGGAVVTMRFPVYRRVDSK